METRAQVAVSNYLNTCTISKKRPEKLSCMARADAHAARDKCFEMWAVSDASTGVDTSVDLS